MGWCHAFGPQIRAGCDHAMVAGRDSCSCAECQVVCRGLFPGCATVWAAGPRKVTLTRPTREPGNLLPVPAASVAPAEGAAPVPVPAGEPSGTEQSDMRALRIDVQLLMWKIDQLQKAPPSDRFTQAAEEIGAVAAALPEQLKVAVAAALESQRQATAKLFTEMQRKIVRDISQLQERVGPLTAGDLDARFQWLVEAVSDRFVTLGNELTRIERQLAGDSGGHAGDRSGNGSGDRSNGASTSSASPRARA